MATLNVIGIDTTTGQQKIYKSGDTISGATAGVTVQDAGSTIVSNAQTINFEDTIFAVTDVAGVATINVTITGADVGVTATSFDYLTGTDSQTLFGQIDGFIGDSSRLLSTTGSIDGTATGATNLFTVPTGKKLIVDKVILEATTFTGTSGTLAAGVGVAAGEEDIYSSTDLIGFDTTGDGWEFDATGSIVLPAASDVVKLGIDTALTGTTATITAYLFGWLV